MNQDNFSIIQSSAGLAADVRDMIGQTRSGVARAVNAGMTFLYWRIGKRVQMEVLQHERAEYGRRILATLSQDLSAEFGRGYSYSALTRMVKFAEVFSEREIVATLSQQLSWSHFVELFILCAGKKEEQIELLEIGDSGIHVAEYLTALPSRELLQQKLHDAIKISQARLEAKKRETE